MALSNEQRQRLEQVQAQELDYVSFAANAVADARKAGMPHDAAIHYDLLNAATSTLDRDDRERDARDRNREVLATLIVAAVATAATVVQAVVSYLQWRAG